jgi:hypothetical protein
LLHPFSTSAVLLELWDLVLGGEKVHFGGQQCCVLIVVVEQALLIVFAIVVPIYLLDFFLIERPAIEVWLVMQPFGEVPESLSLDVVDVTYTVCYRLSSREENGGIVIKKVW